MAERKRYARIDECYNTERTNAKQGSFELQFNGPDQQLTVRLSDFQIEHLAAELHRHIKEREQQIERLKKALKGDQQ
jgi:hypothetical protein